MAYGESLAASSTVYGIYSSTTVHTIIDRVRVRRRQELRSDCVCMERMYRLLL